MTFRIITQQDFIAESKAAHGDKYDYSEALYIDSKVHVRIKCHKHGVFLQEPFKHMRGKGCLICDKVSVFSNKINKLFNGLYDCSEVSFKSTSEEVSVICKKHGMFKKRASYLLTGSGCPECAKCKRNSVQDGESLTDAFIRKAHRVHGDRYDYSQSEFLKADYPVEIICKKHGRFTQKPKNHLCGSGCQQCAIDLRDSVVEPVYIDTDKFIHDAKRVHGDKYTYDKSEYVSRSRYITITCPEHGDFKRTYQHHIARRYGCPSCGKKNHPVAATYDIKGFLERAKAKHGDTYDYSKVVYKNTASKVVITCKIHGDFKQTPNSHLAGCGCAKCGAKIGRSKQTTEEFIDSCKRVHGDTYDYSKVEYTGANRKVIIICKIHGDFKQIAQSHKQGFGCSKCSRLLTKS